MILKVCLHVAFVSRLVYKQHAKSSKLAGSFNNTRKYLLNYFFFSSFRYIYLYIYIIFFSYHAVWISFSAFLSTNKSKWFIHIFPSISCFMVTRNYVIYYSLSCIYDRMLYGSIELYIQLLILFCIYIGIMHKKNV